MSNWSTDTTLRKYAGKTLLVVNVASQCGLTPQYDGLQKLYAQYRARGLEVLGFPCNQFGAQEPGTESQIKTFCETRFGVTFLLFAKLEDYVGRGVVTTSMNPFSSAR